jgi:nicotinamidase-related amidase
VSLNNNAALVIIDVQNGFEDPRWGHRNNPQAEQNIADLLGVWRASGRAVYFIRHMSRGIDSPLRPGQQGNEIKEIVKPISGEPVIEKQVNSAFIGTGLEQRLRTNRHETLVIVGLVAEHCVSTTARMAGNLGFDTYVVSDATASFDSIGPNGKTYPAELVHELSLATLNGEFATVLTTAEVIELAAADLQPAARVTM